MSGALPPVPLRLHGVDRQGFLFFFIQDLNLKSEIFITILDAKLSKHLCSVSRLFSFSLGNPLNESIQKCFYYLGHVGIMSFRLHREKGLQWRWQCGVSSNSFDLPVYNQIISSLLCELFNMFILETLWRCNTGFNWQHDYVRIYSTEITHKIPSDVLHDVAHKVP